MSERKNIIIVGAGVSGLYCAWRLKKDPKHRDANIVILEKLDRTGGRLQTDLVKIKGLSTNGQSEVQEVREEEGGMRFNQSMKELLTLIGELDLCHQLVSFPMGDENNRFCFRGESFTVADSMADNNAIWSALYNLTDAEQGMSPVDIVTAVYHAILAENNVTAPENPTPEFWQSFRLDCTYKGIPLNEWGLWSLLRDFGLSQEAITMLGHAVGFVGPFESLVNAGEAYQILEDFPKNPQFYSFNDGYSVLPNTLADQNRAMGVEIKLNTAVTSLQPTSNEDWIQVQTEDLNTGEPLTYESDMVILALPAAAMKQLFLNSPLLNGSMNTNATQLYENINSVIGMRLSKINLYYDDAWWRDPRFYNRPPVLDGGCFTDLPAGAIYTFDPMEGTSVTGPAALTIYSDFTNTNFWQALQQVGPKFTSPLQEEHNKDKPQVMYAASEAIVEEATKQLQQIFDTLYVPRPVLTSYRLWGESPFGYGYHQWARFANDREVMKNIANPVKNIYICNEAYSDDQGWVNGSLRSSDNVLQLLGLSRLVPDPDKWKNPCKMPQSKTNTTAGLWQNQPNITGG